MEHLKISEALAIVLASIFRQGVETVPISGSLARVLACDILANRDLPPYDVSAMDGYAVRSCDVACANVRLSIVDDIKAGDLPRTEILSGQCARIMTGAPVPPGADAVIRVEDTREISCDSVEIGKTVPCGNDLRRRGENMTKNQVVLPCGTEITAGVAGVLATVKAASFPVYRRPSVAILSTGNELEAIEQPLDENRIPDANSYALMAQVQALGIEPVLLGIARDDPAELEKHLAAGLAYDMLLVSGGTSVGVHDYVRPTLEKLGVNMKFWRVAMKPGHPLAFGTRGESHTGCAVFGLPGNPVSSMVCFEEFVAPALRTMMGNARPFRRTVSAKLAHPIRMRPGRTEFIRVQLQQGETGLLAAATGTQSSGVLLSMARADGLLVAPSDCTGLAAGAEVCVQLLDGYDDNMGYRE